MNIRVILVALFTISFIISCSSKPKNEILAIVDQEPIRTHELSKLLHQRASDYASSLPKKGKKSLTIKRKILADLIEQKILLQMAHEKMVSLTPEEEKTLLKELQSGYQKGQLEKILKEKEIFFDDWLEQQKEKAVIKKLISKEIFSQMKITEEEIKDYYKKNRSAFFQNPQVRCRHIVTNSMEKGEKIKGLIEKGENFAAVAREYSESPDRENGGDLGFFSKDEYPRVFEQTCFALNPGETSSLVSSEYGYHIFRMVDRKPKRSLHLEEVIPQIEAKLKEEKGAQYLQTWLQNIRQQKKILIDEEALKKVEWRQ